MVSGHLIYAAVKPPLGDVGVKVFLTHGGFYLCWPRRELSVRRGASPVGVSGSSLIRFDEAPNAGAPKYIKAPYR